MKKSRYDLVSEKLYLPQTFCKYCFKSHISRHKYNVISILEKIFECLLWSGMKFDQLVEKMREDKPGTTVPLSEGLTCPVRRYT
jgi:hypothetical protein